MPSLFASLAFALALVLAPAARAQSVSDLVQLWLAQAGKVPAVGDYRTCQPEGGVDGICVWNVKALGSQPTTQQLAALVPAWQAQQQATQTDAILKAGVQITSAGTAALSATYACDATWQGYVNAEVSAILLNGAFTNGQATKDWPDMVGASHVFDLAHFKDFATKLSAYVDSVLAAKRALLGGTPTAWPSNAKTIQ